MEIINLTPHEITVHVLGSMRVIPPSGMVARVRTRRFLRDAIDICGLRIPCAEIQSMHLEGLPPQQPGRLHIVSTFVAQHPMVRGRDDLMAPDMNRATRDQNGNVIAVSGFVRYS